MKAADLREKTPEDLLELKKLLARDVFRNRLKNFTNRLDDTSAVRKTRRDLARVLTLLRQGRESVDAKPVAPDVKVADEASPSGAPAKGAKNVEAKDAPVAGKAKKVKTGGDRGPKASRDAGPAGEGARPTKAAAKKSEAKER